MKSSWFTFGLILGVAITGAIITLHSGCQGFIVRQYVRQYVERGNKVIHDPIPDGETHEIFITIERQKMEDPKLSITDVNLANANDRTTLDHLTSGQKAIIMITIKNTGGTAKDIKVTWSSENESQLTNLRLEGGEKITKMLKNSKERYEITVKAEENAQGRDITLQLYPVEKTHRFEDNLYSFPFKVINPVEPP